MRNDRHIARVGNQADKEAISMRYMETVTGSMLTLATLALVVGTGITLI
ncbi:hypothetical protein [Hephaestia mangrovi]|nr:hypothetical protein [Hephaestia mangrovi]MBY8826889.1 hypothetical protein [Hephaestia mangrovi]